MRTFQQLVDLARVPLNDPGKIRYPDTDLLDYANDAVLIVRRMRPDLFFGSWTIPSGSYGFSDPIPIDDTYFPVLADYVTGKAEFRDDEDAMQQRAAAFLQMFSGSL